ncbi:PLP-dependent aminotransferase family protein [Rhizobium sp. KVB221]|uniref:PLP-dependent aminotransferase family protein n=1 Tax=Rhizobium setariae TaxID=2801340 RepID=A0A936YTU8_9HYPH|nr:PLP-dependent aminotransferase family protein [Rhizobium setariae]MBL0374359.1 PLP-dependent aminotransferase family protein [Rhizobium setariae]
MRIHVSETIFFIDRESGLGLQAQLRETIVSAVVAGRIQPSAQLPSTRRLAGYLQISRITVTLAYQELVSQGYVEAVGRSAYRIAGNPPSRSLENHALPEGVQPVNWDSKVTMDFGVVRQVEKPLDWRRYPYPFLYGQMDPSLFDLNAWRDCARRALAREDFILMASDFAASDDVRLVNYICSRTLPRRGIHAKPEEILVTVGAQNALWIVTRLILEKGFSAACENPCHPDISATLLLSGAKVTTIDVDAEGLPPESLPDDIDAVFVTPSHHSPTGATMPIDRRIRLLKAATEKDFVIVEDDYEFEISFLAPPSPALKAFDTTGRVLYIGSFSKSLFPGLRLGYLVAPAPFIRKARSLRSLMLRHPPGHLQRTAAYFLALGHYDAVLHRMRNEYHKRHELMADVLQREELNVAGASSFGGTSFWMEGPDWLDADLLVNELRQDGVLVESGSPFFPTLDGPCRYFRMGYSSIPLANISEGVGRVRRCIERLRPIDRNML